MKLATGDSLSRLQVPPGDTLYVASLDLKDYFHTLRIPARMSQYFCLPLISCRCLRAAGLDVQSEQDFVYPCFASLPMGFSWALWAAQRCHEKLVVQAGLSDSRRLQDGTVPADLATGAVHLEYVDNLVVMGARQGRGECTA